MKIYVIYRKLNEFEYEQACMCSNDDTVVINHMDVYAYSTSKKIAKHFMDIHKAKKFRMKKLDLSEEDFCDFISSRHEQELKLLNLRDKNGYVEVPMTEDEENELMSEYYDCVVSDMSDLIKPVPTCKIFKNKYQKVLDLLGISTQVYQNIADLDEWGSMTGDKLIMTGTGECGFPVAEIEPNTLSVYVALFDSMLSSKKVNKK